MPKKKSKLIRRIANRCVRVLPQRLRKKMESRIFYSIFQSTRVTNDAYGWKPMEKEEGE